MRVIVEAQRGPVLALTVVVLSVAPLLFVGALGVSDGPDLGTELALAADVDASWNEEDSFDASFDASFEMETAIDDSVEDAEVESEAVESEPTVQASRAPRRVVAPTIGVRQTEEERRRGIRGIRVSGTALVATGASVAQGADGANANVSPAMLTVDAGFSHPELPWLEMGPGMMLELERGVTFGVALRMRAFLLTRRIRPYAMVGGAAFVAPQTLFGAQVAGGVAFKLHRVFAIAAEFGPTVFFAGNDLTDGGVLVKVDGALGIRVGF